MHMDQFRVHVWDIERFLKNYLWPFYDRLYINIQLGCKDYIYTGIIYGNSFSNSFTMITIYFDTHVFSHLYKGQEEKFQVLRRKILEHKDEFIFLYSDAHLQDLYNDPTDTKYREMEFMKEIVNEYHIAYKLLLSELSQQLHVSVFNLSNPLKIPVGLMSLTKTI